MTKKISDAMAMDLIINPEKLTGQLTNVIEELCQISHLAMFANMAIKKANESDSSDDVTLSYGEIEGMIGVMDSFISRSQTVIGDLSDLSRHIEFPDLKWGIHKEVSKP